MRFSTPPAQRSHCRRAKRWDAELYAAARRYWRRSLRTEQRLEIDCGACVLRPWRAGDEAALVRHANSRAIWLNLRDQFPHPYTAADAEGWIKFASAQSPPTSLAIEVGEAVGGVSVRLHGDVERVSAELGYWLGEAFWNRGIMSAAVPAFTRYVFQQFSLTRVFRRPLRNQHRIAAGAREGRLRAGRDAEAERNQGRQSARSGAVRYHRPRSRTEVRDMFGLIAKIKTAPGQRDALGRNPGRRHCGYAGLFELCRCERRRRQRRHLGDGSLGEPGESSSLALASRCATGHREG